MRLKRRSGRCSGLGCCQDVVDPFIKGKVFRAVGLVLIQDLPGQIHEITKVMLINEAFR